MNHAQWIKAQALLDGELSEPDAHEVRALLAKDPEAQAIFAELQQTKELVAGQELEIKLPETREFYWSKIEREISRSASASLRPKPSLLNLWLRWATPIAGSALLILVATVWLKTGKTTPELASYYHEIETPLQEASTMTFHSEEAGMLVARIDTSGE